MFDAVCGGADVLRVIRFIWMLLDIVFFVVPIVLIVMISLDFAKSVIAGKDDEMRKNLGIVIKRIIYCVALFLVEPICALVIDMATDAAPDPDAPDWNWLDCINIATDENAGDEGYFEQYEIEWPNESNNTGTEANS